MKDELTSIHSLRSLGNHYLYYGLLDVAFPLSLHKISVKTMLMPGCQWKVSTMFDPDRSYRLQYIYWLFFLDP